MVRFRLVLSVTGLLAACAGGEGGGGPGPDLVVPADRVEGDTTALVVSGLSAAVTPGNTLAARVLWSTDTPASSALDLDCGEGWSHHLETSGLRTSHEVFLMGLWDGADCTATVTSITAEGLEGGGTVRFTAGPLPDLLPPLDLVVHDPQLAQPGWTVFNLSNHYDRVPLLLAVVDGEGRYRWYHRRATDSSGAATSVYVLPEGLLVGGTFDSGRIWPALIDWEGTVVWERELDMHHDLHPLADGTWLWLGHAETCPGDIPNGGTVNGYDPVADETTWTWSFCDHYTPDPVVKDWDHLNAVVRAPAGDGLLISAKNQNAIFKFDPGSGEVLWRLGQDGDFTRTDGDGLAFANQHAADFIAADRILLFDNGAEGWREESGAVELRIDEETRTFEVAWSWYPDPPVFAPIWSDADRLDNGNTLVTFGRRDPALDSHLIEVTPAGERVWHLVTPEKWGWYRAERIP
ncbi:MAG: aryl-sulfate sulfotransferase, partial [Deltaproteobacteria bacterium]|nr:aryl-sulfate sulfotransferase [Deltaproteobacteria bacterium]